MLNEKYDEPFELDDEVPTDLPPVEDEIEESTKEVPQHIKLVIAVSEKILHILPHRNTPNKILIIEVIIKKLLLWLSIAVILIA